MDPVGAVGRPGVGGGGVGEENWKTLGKRQADGS